MNLSPEDVKNPYSHCYPAVLLDHHMVMMSFCAGRSVGILFPVIIREHTRAYYVMICTAMYIDELEVTLHLCSHFFGVARELFPDALNVAPRQRPIY